MAQNELIDFLNDKTKKWDTVSISNRTRVIRLFASARWNPQKPGQKASEIDEDIRSRISDEALEEDFDDLEDFLKDEALEEDFDDSDEALSEAFRKAVNEASEQGGNEEKVEDIKDI